MTLKRFSDSSLPIAGAIVAVFDTQTNAYGETIVLWQKELPNSFKTEYYFQVLDSQNLPTGPAKLFTTLNYGAVPGVYKLEIFRGAVLDSGEFSIIWSAKDYTNNTPYETISQTVSRQGELIGDGVVSTEISSLTLATWSYPWLVETGNSEIPFAALSTLTETIFIGRIEFYDASLTKLGPTIDLSSIASALAEETSIVVLEDGKFAVIYNGQNSPLIAIFGASGEFVKVQTVEFENGYRLNYGNPQVVALSNGGFALTWGVRTVYEKIIQYSQVFDQDGNPTADQVILGDPEQGVYRICDVGEGRYLVAWKQQSSRAGNSNPLDVDIFFRILTSDGQSVTSNIYVANAISDFYNFLAEVAQDGKVRIAWSDLKKHAIKSATFDAKSYAFTNGDDHWIGFSSETKLHGLKGNDIIGGSANKNFIYGDEGDDVLFTSAGIDILYGGTGSDTANYAHDKSGVTIALDHSISTKGSAVKDKLTSIENLTGSLISRNTLVGDSKSNVLTGGLDDDLLIGGSGDDVLVVGTGNDRVFGGPGFDMIDYSSINPIEKFTRPALGIFLSLDNLTRRSDEAKGDTLSSIEGIIGTAMQSDTLIGDDNDNKLIGNGGDDKLYGRGGNDILNSGIGNDTLSGGAGFDTADFSWSQRQVKVNLELNNFGFAEKALLENYYGKLYSIESVIGSSNYADTILGNKFANQLKGLGGNDFLFGGGGNDDLHGGAGKDIIDGSTGTDIANYSDENYVYLALDRSFARAGSSIGDKHISIEGIAGSNFGNDKLAGNSGDNTLKGGGGNDQLYGRAGNDELEGGAGIDLLDGGTGSDIASYFDDARVSIALDGSFAASGAGVGDKLHSIEGLSGSNFGNDRLTGDAHNNVLLGNGGNDILTGRAGEDVLAGGLGYDTLRGGHGNDYFYFSGVSSFGDTIMDFDIGDKLVIGDVIEDFEFANPEVPLEEHFQIGNSNKANNRSIDLIFRTTDHTLWFDKDGSGSIFTPIKVAKLSNSHELGVDDFIVF